MQQVLDGMQGSSQARRLQISVHIRRRTQSSAEFSDDLHRHLNRIFVEI